MLRDSKASGFQFGFRFIAAKPMDKSGKADAIPQFQRFLPPAQKETGESGRPMDKNLIA